MGVYEQAQVPKNVQEVDPAQVVDPYERKTVLAMQATILADTEQFDDANSRLIAHCAGINRPPTLTYEDLIFVNPLNEEPYVMSSDPGIAEHEVAFYRAHRVIENDMEQTIDGLQAGMFDIAIHGLRMAARGLSNVHRSLDRQAFAAFRPYFRGINGYPGPSGLFSASIPIVDLLVHEGANVAEDEQTRLVADVDRGLYPIHQAGLLRELLVADNASIDMPPDVREEIVGLLNVFRKVHRGNVRRFVPQALHEQAEGSGGMADVAAYLNSKLITLQETK